MDQKRKIMPQTIKYTITILHVRPEISDNADFLLTYHALENRGKSFVEEMFTKAFKQTHPSWIIKKVTVEQNCNSENMYHPQIEK